MQTISAGMVWIRFIGYGVLAILSLASIFSIPSQNGALLYGLCDLVGARVRGEMMVPGSSEGMPLGILVKSFSPIRF